MEVKIAKMDEEIVKEARLFIHDAEHRIDDVRKELREARNLNDVTLIKWKLEEAEQELRAVEQRLNYAIELLHKARIY